ncbi:Cytochrome P450, partial [Theobroma cacao]
LYAALETLLSQHGPVLYLQFGSRRVLVVSSPSAIEECFTKNDIIFANRPQTMAGDILTDKYVTIAWAPYGDLWRNLRRLSVVEIFSANSLQRVRSIREEEVRNCVQQLSKL